MQCHGDSLGCGGSREMTYISPATRLSIIALLILTSLFSAGSSALTGPTATQWGRSGTLPGVRANEKAEEGKPASSSQEELHASHHFPH